MYGCERDRTNLAMLNISATIDHFKKRRKRISAEVLEKELRYRLLSERSNVTEKFRGGQHLDVKLLCTALLCTIFLCIGVLCTIVFVHKLIVHILIVHNFIVHKLIVHELIVHKRIVHIAVVHILIYKKFST